jgi:hypothetical protein
VRETAGVSPSVKSRVSDALPGGKDVIVTVSLWFESIITASLLAAPRLSPSHRPCRPGIGPQAGSVVPFSGVDQFGKTQTLESLSGPKGLMLVFIRSADW